MTHQPFLLQPAPVSAYAAPPPPAVGLSIVVPVYRGAATVGLLVEALSDLAPEGGIEVVLVNDGSRTTRARCAATCCALPASR